MARKNGQAGLPAHPAGTPFRNSFLMRDKATANSFLPSEMDTTIHGADTEGVETNPSGTGVMNVGSIPSGRLDGGFGAITPSKGNV